MATDAGTRSTSSTLRFKVEGLDCQNEVRLLRAAVGPVVGGEDRLSFDTKGGVMEATVPSLPACDAIEQAVASTGMRAQLLAEPDTSSASAWLFKVDGLDCKNEVAMLKREIGPLVGGEDRLAFDTAKGLMTVAPQQRASIDELVSGISKTGMSGSLIRNGLAEAMLLRVRGLDCKNEVAALTRELGPLVGEDNLAFDTSQGAMTVAPQSGATLRQIEEAVARTGMRAEPWSPPAVSEAACSETAGSGCGCAGQAQEALAPPLPTNQPGGVVYRIHGMDCADEIAALKREVGPLVGEDKLAFDLLNGRMSIDMVPDAALEASIEKAVGRAGLRAEPWIEGASSEAAQAEERRRRIQSWLTAASGVFAALGFAVHAWLGGGIIAAFEAGEHAAGSTPLPSIILYTLAVLCAVRYVAPKAWLAARRFRPDMNLLMVVAVVGAIGIGAWFEAATVSFFFALALALEAWSLGRARRAVAALMELAPPTARVKLDDGSERDVPAAEIRVGSHIIIRPGDKLPLDGRVAAG
ncbi:P-type ATPase, partial [Bosea spartocytisi]|nr:heavy metal translocating P-type ATPase [Bosea spartocytisi]